MKCFASTVEIFSSTVTLDMLNILHLTIATRSSLTRLYLSSCVSTLPFTSPLTLLRLLFSIPNLQSLLPSCTGGRNIRTSGTAMYIFIAVTCNTTLHLRFHTYATTCYTSCPLIFTLKVHGYFLTLLSRNTMKRDFFAWVVPCLGVVPEFNRIRKSHELGGGVISI